MEYKVVSKCNHNEVWARGFYDEYGKEKAQKRIDEGYFHKYMYDYDKHKVLIVISACPTGDVSLTNKTQGNEDHNS